MFGSGLSVVKYENNDDKISWHSDNHLKVILFSLINESITSGNQVVIANAPEFIKQWFSNFSPQQRSEELIIKEWENFKLNPFPDVTLLENEILFKNLTKELNYIVKCRNQDTFGNKSFNSLYQAQHKAQQQFSRNYLEIHLNSDNYDFNQAEYWLIRGRIKNAQELFKAEFRLLNKQNPFQDNIFINEEGSFSTSVLLKYLASFQSKAEYLQQKYIEFFTKIKENIYQSIDQKITDGISLAYKIQSFTQIDLPIEIMNNKLITICNEIPVYSISPKLAENLISNKSIDNSLEHIISGLKLSYSKINNHYNSVLRSMNIRSNTDPQLLLLENELDQLIQSINDSHIYKQEIENNSISSLKKYNNLKEIIDLLVSSIDQLIIMVDYYAWKAFVATMPDKIKAILSSLESIEPSKWHHAFESWYFHQVSLSILKTKNNRYKEQLLLYKDLSDNRDNNLYDYLQNNINAFRIKKLKSNQEKKGILRKLKSQNHKINFDVSPIKNDTVLNYFYPIQFVSSIENFGEENKIYISFEKEINQDHKGVFYFEHKKSAQASLNFFHHSLIQGKITNVEIGQKLSFARFLAKALSKNSENISLYISQETNFIFDCSPWLMDQILSIQSLELLKKVRSNKDITQQLTEFFLNEAPNGIYIYDSFKQYDSQPNIYYHSQVIKSMEKAGYSTIFLDLAELVDDEDYIYKQIELIPDHVW